MYESQAFDIEPLILSKCQKKTSFVVIDKRVGMALDKLVQKFSAFSTVFLETIDGFFELCAPIIPFGARALRFPIVPSLRKCRFSSLGPARRIIAFPAFFLVVNSRDGPSSGEGGDFGTKDKEGVVSCKAKTDLQVRIIKQNLSVFLRN